MKIIFRTNIDAYQTNCFPNNLESVPRVGELIMVVETFISYYKNKQLPTILEVVQVVHTEKGVICELHYSDIDVKSARINKINLYP